MLTPATIGSYGKLVKVHALHYMIKWWPSPRSTVKINIRNEIYMQFWVDKVLTILFVCQYYMIVARQLLPTFGRATTRVEYLGR